MIKEFYSNGKLLLSGEYAVLDGAYAWAIPTKYGQSLKVTEKNPSTFMWRSYDEKGSIWFEGRYSLAPLEEISSSDVQLSKTLLQILSRAQQLNPDFLSGALGYEVETKLNFPRNWGLGTSSTLVNNIAQWATINPYDLLKATFGGSGYDIACAQYHQPLLFQLTKGEPTVLEITTNMPFANALYFIYLNAKKNSREAISDYKSRAIDSAEFANKIGAITRKMVVTDNLQDFEALIELHEEEVSTVLGIAPIQARLFPDYWGKVKSLGAWGGDFILATGNQNTPSYFKKKGYDVIIPYSHMVYASS